MFKDDVRLQFLVILERIVLLIRKDDVVVQGHPYRLSSLSELCCNSTVELCRRGIPTDMVMYCNNVGRIVEHPESHDVSRVSSILRHLSPADSDSSEQFMFRIKEHEY